jgi:hypothetical protein
MASRRVYPGGDEPRRSPNSYEERTFMNLLCPNCQKMLTVPEEFAGQAMKCPLCSSTFTVPGLPGAAPPPPPSAAPETDVYSIRHEPSSPPPPPPMSFLPSPPPPPAAAATLPPTPKPSLAREDYQRGLSGSLNPQVLPWIAPLCLVLMFFLQFFDWDGLYPGGEPAVTGNAWGAAFGAYTVDGDLKNLVNLGDDFRPGASALTIFYLLLFFPAFLVTVASVLLPILQLKLPPWVKDLMPWRWGIVTAANLLVFLFLALQLLLGFSLDSRYRDWVDTQTKRTESNPTTQERKTADATRGELLERLRHTFWLRLVVLLHLMAIISSALMFWIDRRGQLLPLPKWELRW